MQIADHERNPMRPVSIPLAIRGVLAIALAASLVLGFAREMMSGFQGQSSVALLAALLLLVFAALDVIFAFKTSLRLPEHSLQIRGIGRSYSASEIHALMVSGVSPNEKYLSWVGRWVARASPSFFSLPPLYQRLVEVALMAITYGLVALVLIVVVRVFGMAGGNTTAADAVISWLFFGVVLLAYAYWATILSHMYNAANWARKLAPAGIVKLLRGLLVLVVAVALVAQFSGWRVPVAPSLQPWSGIVIIGTIGLVIGILVLAALRADKASGEMSRSRTTFTDNAATHPDVILDSFRSVLTQPLGGAYAELGEWKLRLEEQPSTGGGVFSGLAVGEYGIKVQDLALPTRIRRFAAVLAILAIVIGAMGYVSVWVAARSFQHAYWVTAFCLLLFSDLAFRVAILPLTERVWKSYLIAVQISGSYHRRGGMLGAELFTSFRLNGGVAAGQSVSHVTSSLVKADATRVLTSTRDDEEQLQVVFNVLRAHIQQAPPKTAAVAG